MTKVFVEQPLASPGYAKKIVIDLTYLTDRLTGTISAVHAWIRSRYRNDNICYIFDPPQLLTKITTFEL